MSKIIKLLDLGSFESGLHRPPFIVPVGTTVVGRGDFLKCKSTDVSRSHALLTADPNGNLTLTTNNKKPCYYKHSGDEDRKVLKESESVQLHHGDVFSLTASSSGFEIQVFDAQPIVPNNDPVPSGSKDVHIKTPSKRKFPAWMDDSDDEQIPLPMLKKQAALRDEDVKQEDVNDTDSKSPTRILEVENEDKTEAKAEVNNQDECKQSNTSNEDNNNEQGASVAHENIDTTLVNTSTQNEKDVTVNAGDASNDDEDNDVGVDAQNSNAPPSQSVPQRPTCKYAGTCYRKNPQHKADFCHPGDPDFIAQPNVDPNISRPFCPYGTSCYRVNPQHKIDFDHSQPPASLPSPSKTRATRKKANDNKKTADWDSGSEESYDESFIDDNSSDNYHPDDDTESDEEDWE